MTSPAVSPSGAEQEVRFAVVLYGGVSLAIYMNGIAQELLRMVRATADLPPGETLSGTEAIYRELGQRMHRGGVETDAGERPMAAPIRTRFVVDIISGSSAGGINGIALAKAIALRSRNLDTLKATWLGEAQIDRLLNDQGSEPATYPPHPGGKTASLLNGERMYGLVLRTLQEMSREAGQSAGGQPFADKLDLFVTATDLAGLPAPIQLTGQTIDERIHKTVFHFEYAPSPASETEPASKTEPESETKPESGTNEFGPDYDPMLAFAARCTSSFPVAFEPMRFARMEHQLAARRTGMSIDQAAKHYADFFPAYRAQGVPFLNRAFADGGYLDNRPFSHAIDLIPYRSSRRPVKRKLLFVDPFPEIHDHGRLEADRDFTFYENGLLAAMSLPRYEVIRDDIKRVNAINRRLYRLAALERRVRFDRARLEIADKPSPDNFAELDLRDMVRTAGYGEFYPLYHHMRVYDLTDSLARMVTRLAGFETDSDEYLFVRQILRAWREGTYAPYRTEGKRTENAFFDAFDFDYRMRRLNHLRAWIDERLRTGKIAGGDAGEAPDGRTPQRLLTAEESHALEQLRDTAEAQLARLRDITRTLQSRTRSPLLRSASEQALKQELGQHFETVMREPDPDRRYRIARVIYRRSGIRPKVEAVMRALQSNLAVEFDRNREEMAAVFLAAQGRGGHAAPEAERIYRSFHWHDVLSLPFLDGSDVQEHSEIEVYRVSPADSGLVPCYVRLGKPKLAGAGFGAFAGFFQQSWREHDMMWGRLDGAERIIAALLPGTAEDVAALRERFVRRMQDTILAEEFGNGRGAARVFEWLAHRLRETDVTNRPVDELISRGKELLATFPSLSAVVSQRDFRTFLERFYEPPPPPSPQTAADWAARSLKIFGRMIDDLPNARGSGLMERVGSACRSAGVLLTLLLRFAVPQSLGRKLADHWLALIAVAGLLMIVAGPLVGAGGVALAGYGTLFACLGAWIVLRVFGQWMRGRIVLRDVAVSIGGLSVIVLVMLGGLKAWEIVGLLSQRVPAILYGH